MALKPKKAVAEQGKLKVAIYGRSGTGKSATSLLVAEMIAREEGKRICYISTQPGDVDFYTLAIPERKFHPAAFDFDIIQTKQLLEVRDFLNPKLPDSIDTKKYGVLVIDSMSHLWDSANELYTGKKTRNDQNPIYAYATIKKPFRQMLDNARSLDMHLIICGREQNEFERHSSDDWEFKGTRMRAEKETGHEPDITVQMRQEREDDKRQFKIVMFVEKDHSGLLQGQTIEWPNGETFKPWLSLLKGVKHVPGQTIEEAAELDASTQAREEEYKSVERATLYSSMRDSMMRSNTMSELEAAWSLTVGKKMKLGDDAYDSLKAVKDSEKARILQIVLPKLELVKKEE